MDQSQFWQAAGPFDRPSSQQWPPPQQWQQQPFLSGSLDSLDDTLQRFLKTSDATQKSIEESCKRMEMQLRYISQRLNDEVNTKVNPKEEGQTIVTESDKILDEKNLEGDEEKIERKEKEVVEREERKKIWLCMSDLRILLQGASEGWMVMVGRPRRMVDGLGGRPGREGMGVSYGTWEDRMVHKPLKPEHDVIMRKGSVPGLPDKDWFFDWLLFVLHHHILTDYRKRPQNRHIWTLHNYNSYLRSDHFGLGDFATADFLFMPFVHDDHWWCYLVKLSSLEIFVIDSLGKGIRDRKRIDTAVEELLGIRKKYVCDWILDNENIRQMEALELYGIF
ncbi:hypothetical protein LR48_Vigan01g124900 [Vigna angularis]|uniref:Ubiquitin-like protease family profile domain-containing protein n=1 Tax=Phaseolus angularis TaxID=3914 RepID=A0A0L9TNE3_PHAAN|nr:hypothetical protein LR48_Vigan01g124900 [Vigna angularis]